MKKAVLVHNPGAGSGNHKKEDLKKLIEKVGYDVKYYSTERPFWDHFTSEDAEIIFVAGGDGTVQKLSEAMLKAKDELLLQVPVQIVPCGTANNIATTLKIKDREQALTASGKKTGFDIGAVEGVEGVSFFIEGIGCGIFPGLVRVMNEKNEDKIEDELKHSLTELLKLIDSYEAKEAIIIADKEEITGKFLLVELLNIKYIGPNIELAPGAETGDGHFELVTVREEARQHLRSYVAGLLNGSSKALDLENFAEIKKVQQVRLKWDGGDVHVDDEILKEHRGEEIGVQNRQGILTFLNP